MASVRALVSAAPPLLIALAVLGLVLSACGPGRLPRGSGSEVWASDDRAAFDESSSAAALRRLFSAPRTGPSGR